MKKSTRFNGAPPPQVAGHRQAKILLPEHHLARVGAKPKSSRLRPMNHLAWYVPLKTKESERKNARIHQIKWKCPPEISLNPEWQVAAGEESKLTAVTPSSPLTWPLVEADCHDDSQTPIIPIIPIEEVGAEMSSDTPVTVITCANPQPSASCPSVAECPNRHVHEKSLSHRLQGLEDDDLIAASAAITIAALTQKRPIDSKLVVKYLTDLNLMEKVKSGDGLASKPEDEAQPASKSNTCLHLPSLTLDSMVEKPSKAALSDPTPQTVNQSLFLPSTEDETDIKKCASKLGGIASGSHVPKADKQSHFLSCTKSDSEISICASKLEGIHAGSGLSRQMAENQTPSLPGSKAETEIKAASKPGVTRVGNKLSTPKAEIKAASKPGGMHVGNGLSRQRAENQTPSLPCSKAETEIKAASKPGGMHVGIELSTPKLEIKSACKPGGMHVGNGLSTPTAEIKAACKPRGMRVGNGPSTPKADNQSPLPPCSKAETEIDKTVREPGRMRAESGTCTVKVEDQSSFVPCSKSVPGINNCSSILGGLHAGSGFKKQKVENRSPFLPCSKAGKTINKTVGTPGGIHVVSGQSTPKTYNQSPLLPCTKASTESNNGASKLGGMPAVSVSHLQKADYQSPLLPCSNAETEINKTVRKPGGMCDGSGPGTSKAAVSEINSCASKLGGMHVGLGTSNAAVSEIKSCASKLGGMDAGLDTSKAAVSEISSCASKLGGMHAGPGTSKAAVSEISSCASKLGGMHAGPGTSKAAVSEISSCASKLGGMHAPSGPHIQKAENQSSILPCTKSISEFNKDASALEGMLAGSGPPTKKGEKRPSPSPGLNSDRPTKKLTDESGRPARPCTDQIVRDQKVKSLVSSSLRANEEINNERTKDNGGSDITGVKPANSLSPYPSNPKMEEMKKMVHDYGCDVAQVKPMAPLVAPPSVLPNEEMDRMIHKYLSLDHGRSHPFLGPSPPLLPPIVPFPATNLHAYPNALDPHFNGTGTFHLSLQPMSHGRQVYMQYHQPQIIQHGEIPNIWQSGNYSQGHNINRRIEMNPIYQRPCMHFSNPARCPNGYNCPYQHGMSRQWSGGGGGPPGGPWWPRR